MERKDSRKTGPKTERGPKVWIEKPNGGGVKPVFVSLGITDGAFTELKQAGLLAEDQEIVTGLLTPTDTGKTVNPFTPQVPGNARRATR
jgi:hypothetical protein